MIFLMLMVSQVLPTWSEELTELNRRDLYNEPFSFKELLKKSPFLNYYIDLDLFDEKEITIIEVFLTDLNVELRKNHQCRTDEDNNACFERSCPIIDGNEWDQLLCIFKGSVLEDYSLELAENISQLNETGDFLTFMAEFITIPLPKGLEGISPFRTVEKTNDGQSPDLSEVLDDFLDDFVEQQKFDRELDDMISAVIDSPPLLNSEIENFRESVAECWGVKNFYNPKKGSVTLAFAMDRQGKIDPDSLKSISNTFEDSRSAQNAFQRAKRALMKCGVNGYDLPASKYQHWKRMELTFEQ